MSKGTQRRLRALESVFVAPSPPSGRDLTGLAADDRLFLDSAVARSINGHRLGDGADRDRYHALLLEWVPRTSGAAASRRGHR